MNRIGDERVAFYLKHQRRIDEWAALAETASAEAHEFLCSLGDDMDRLAAEFGPGVSVEKDSDSATWPSFLFALPEWYAPDGDLRVGVGIQWHRTSTLGFTIPDKCANTGVWTHRDLDGGLELSRRIKLASLAAGLLKQHDLKSSVWWPAHRWELAQGEFWNDLAPYRQQILASIRFFWTTFMPIIQATLTA